MKKKPLKILAALAAFAILAGLGWFANAMVGNPVSRYLAGRTARDHLAQTYPGTDYEITKVSYNFKDGYYHAFVESPSSADTYFTIAVTMTGALRYDEFSLVAEGFNTARRLEEEYRTLCDTVLEASDFPYTLSIGYGTLEIYPRFAQGEASTPSYALIQEDLELDGRYDIRQLGAEAGHLILYVDSDDVSPELAAEVLLEVRQRMEEVGVPFFAVDLTLRPPTSQAGAHRPADSVTVCHVPCASIQEEELVLRIQEAQEATAAYYEAMDAEK